MAGPCAAPARPAQRARRAGRGGARGGASASRIAEFPPVPVPEHSILVAPQSDGALAQLLRPCRAARPLRAAARADHRPRSCARRAAPAARGGLQTENAAAAGRLRRGAKPRAELIGAASLRARSPSISPRPGQRPGQLSAEPGGRPRADRRSPPAARRGRAARRRRHACCARRPATWPCWSPATTQEVLPGPRQAVLVPFGGAEHDWAALELGAWIAAATGRRCSCSAPPADRGAQRVARLLGDAAARPAVRGRQRRAGGSRARPRGRHRGRDQGAGLLVVGLSERWRQEGLGPTRSEIARAAPAPVVFVRRGTRPGALAPRRT